MGYSNWMICQRLGISLLDFEGYLEKCIKMDILDKRFEFTEHGLNLYVEAKKCIEKAINNKYEKKNTFQFHKIAYFPKTFNGKT